jgi:hypothetical protein
MGATFHEDHKDFKGPYWEFPQYIGQGCLSSGTLFQLEKMKFHKQLEWIMPVLSALAAEKLNPDVANLVDMKINLKSIFIKCIIHSNLNSHGYGYYTSDVMLGDPEVTSLCMVYYKGLTDMLAKIYQVQLN